MNEQVSPNREDICCCATEEAGVQVGDCFNSHSGQEFKLDKCFVALTHSGKTKKQQNVKSGACRGQVMN